MLAVGVPIAAYVAPMLIADPSMVSQAAASPKPGDPGGNHSKPGDDKKKKSDNEKNNRDSSSSKNTGSNEDSTNQRDSGSGSDFADQTNANNRWSSDGANRSVNTGTPSQVDPPQQPEQPVYDGGQPNDGNQDAPQAPAVEQPSDTATPPQESVQQGQTPTNVVPRNSASTSGSQPTATASPPQSPPNNPVGPATAVVLAAAAAAAGAASRSRSTNRIGASATEPQRVRGGFSATAEQAQKRVTVAQKVPLEEQPWDITGEVKPISNEFPDGSTQLGVEGRYGLRNKDPISVAHGTAGEYGLSTSIEQALGLKGEMSITENPSSATGSPNSVIPNASAFGGYDVQNEIVVSGPGAHGTITNTLKIGPGISKSPATGTPIGPGTVFQNLGGGKYYVNVPLSVSPLRYVDVETTVQGVVDVPRLINDVTSGFGQAGQWITSGIPSLLGQ